jgi:hypothetical protein
MLQNKILQVFQEGVNWTLPAALCAFALVRRPLPLFRWWWDICLQLISRVGIRAATSKVNNPIPLVPRSANSLKNLILRSKIPTLKAQAQAPHAGRPRLWCTIIAKVNSLKAWRTTQAYQNFHLNSSKKPVIKSKSPSFLPNTDYQHKLKEQTLKSTTFSTVTNKDSTWSLSRRSKKNWMKKLKLDPHS